MPDGKAELLAHLAGNRAHVWEQMLALPAEVLEHQAVAEQWTPKDVLAHLAFWDAWRSSQMAGVLAGEISEIPTHDADAINARVEAERRDWPLERVVEAVMTARAGLLALVEPLTEADLERTFTFIDEPMTVRGWIQRRARHDEVHLAPVREWRHRTKPKWKAGPKVVLTAALTACRDALLAYGALLPADTWKNRPVCGEWTWQDVLGHVADWEFHSIYGLQALAQGRPRERVGDDVDAWNAAHVAARRGELFSRSWSDFYEARAELLALLQCYDDQSLALPTDTPDSFFSQRYHLFAVCAAHDVEHIEVFEQTQVAA